jgi:hypothetical protein
MAAPGWYSSRTSNLKLSPIANGKYINRVVPAPWPLGLKAGIYEGKLGQLLDQLETEEFIRKMSQ